MARAPAPQPTFLARDSYRARRLADVARIWPIIGALAFVLPLLSMLRPATSASASVAGVMIYLFGAWAVAVLGALVLARKLRAAEASMPASAKSPEV